MEDVAEPDVVNVHDAKTHFSRLLERVEGGEEIVLGRAGRPVARMIPYRGKDQPRRVPGALKGKIIIHDNFDDPLPPDIAEAFGA